MGLFKSLAVFKEKMGFNEFSFWKEKKCPLHIKRQRPHKFLPALYFLGDETDSTTQEQGLEFLLYWRKDKFCQIGFFSATTNRGP